jgi:GNAT superfamily N-acetyltransferase
MAMIPAIMERLREEPFTNITLLKMLESYASDIRCWLVEQEHHWGTLLLLPTEASAYDRHTYPDTDYVAFIAASSAQVVPKLIEPIPAGAKLVFKLQKAEYARRLAEYYRLEKARAFISFTSPSGGATEYSLDAEVAVHDRPDDRLLPLWYANGYRKEEIEQYFARDALSFTVFEGETPVSTCLAFPNYESIWEVGAVHTREDRRGRGLARKVVCAALHTLTKNGSTPRYSVLETNTASVRLAESVGLLPFVTLEHYPVTR